MVNFSSRKKQDMKPGLFLTAFFFLALGFFNCVKAVSVGQVIGQITEKENNKPISYAEVTFENSMDKVVVTANEYGYYYADHLPTGKYQMRVSFNNRTFFANKIRVYDGYTSEINLSLSNNNSLPSIVQLEDPEPAIFVSNDVVLKNSSVNQPTRSLSEVLSVQPGMDVVNGKLYVKGSSRVQFFIDGTPVMGPPVLQRVW